MFVLAASLGLSLLGVMGAVPQTTWKAIPRQAPSSALVYSTDGGASWTTAANVAPAGTVLTRIHFA
jgi:hypothetical protein